MKSIWPILAFLFSLTFAITHSLAADPGESGPGNPAPAPGIFSSIGTKLEGLSSYLNATIGKPVPLVDAEKFISSYAMAFPEDGNVDIMRNYVLEQKKCESRYPKAVRMCASELSPEIQNFSKIAPTLIAGAATLADQCSGMAKYANLGQIAVTAFNGICSGAKVFCNNSCGVAARNAKMLAGMVETIRAKIRTECTPASVDNNLLFNCGGASGSGRVTISYSSIDDFNTAVVQDSNEQLESSGEYGVQSAAFRNSKCNDVALQVGSSIPAVIQYFQQANADADKCKKDSEGGTGNEISVAALDCMGRDANTPECICIKNPRTTGCANGYSNGSQDYTLSSGGLAATSARAGNAMGAGTTNSLGGGFATQSAYPGGPNDYSGKAKSGGAGSAGGGGGSGGGKAGIAAGSAGGNPLAATAANKLDISGDEASAGGGGGGRGRSGSGYGSGGSRYGGLNAYAPGGAKDPNRKLAGWSLPKDITGQSGKSNWEKVRDRYNDNRPSLMGH